MRSIKKILLGISLILFGMTLCINFNGSNINYMTVAGWVFSLIGLITSLSGYYSTDD